MKKIINAALLFLFVSCTGSKSHNRQTLVLPNIDDAKGADPVQINDAISNEFCSHIFEGLYRYGYGKSETELVPSLAVGMPKISKDLKTYTIKIRSNAFYHPDPAFPNSTPRAVTASDFVYALKRTADPAYGSVNWWTLDGVIEGLNSFREKLASTKDAELKKKIYQEGIKGIEAPNNETLIIHLTKPYPQLLFVLAMTHTNAVAPEVVEKYGAGIMNHPIGSGPYMLKEWVRGSKIVMTANPNYSGESKPHIATVNFETLKEEQPRWLRFLNGDLDEVFIPKDNFAEAITASGEIAPELAAKGMILHKSPTMIAWWLEFNMKDTVVGKNLKLRQALAFAFDREKAHRILMNNRGILADSMLPPQLEGGDAAPPYPYALNLEKAKALLAEAGYPGGKGLPELSFDLRGPATTQRQLGEFLRDNFSKIGVTLNIIGNSFPEALDKAKQAKFQMMLGGWSADYPDSENFMQLFYSKNAAPGTNSSNFSDPKFDALYEKIRTLLPSSERKKLVLEMVKIVTEQAPVIYFYHQMDYILVQSYIKNYKPRLMRSYIPFASYLEIQNSN